MADLASQAGLVLRNVTLIEELKGVVVKRLVAAQDEECWQDSSGTCTTACSSSWSLSRVLKLGLARRVRGARLPICARSDPCRAQADANAAPGGPSRPGAGGSILPCSRTRDSPRPSTLRPARLPVPTEIQADGDRAVSARTSRPPVHFWSLEALRHRQVRRRVPANCFGWPMVLDVLSFQTCGRSTWSRSGRRSVMGTGSEGIVELARGARPGSSTLEVVPQRAPCSLARPGRGGDPRRHQATGREPRVVPVRARR